MLKRNILSDGLGNIISLADDLITKHRDDIIKNPSWSPYEFYEICNSKASQIKYDSKNVENFVNNHFSDYLINNNRRSSYALGILIAALINNLEDFSVLELKLQKKIDFFGYNLKKNHKIYLYGDSGCETGETMSKGCLLIYGNSEDVGFLMEGGVIKIRGSVESAGPCMKGGIININGNAGEVGAGMSSGRVSVIGEVKRAGEGMLGGEIFIKEKVNMIGEEMEDGKVIIEGKAKEVSNSMMGGEVYISDTCNKLNEREGGKVYIKGKEVKTKHKHLLKDNKSIYKEWGFS